MQCTALKISFIFLIILYFNSDVLSRNLQCNGNFTLKSSKQISVLDNYSTSLIPERIHPKHRIRMKLHVSSAFSHQSLSSLNCKILNVRGTTIYVECPVSLIDTICLLNGIQRCSISHKILPLLDSARNQSGVDIVHGTSYSTSLSATFTGAGVLAGIIDTEFDTRHPAFLDSDGKTRFIALWDQLDTTNSKPNRFGYGVIKNRTEILSDSTFGCAEGNHGTHTTCTMTGSDWKSGYYGAAPDALIAAVRYGGSEEVIDAISWLFSLADSLGLPCVINLSLGIPNGPHDGTSSIDYAIDSLSGPGKIIVGAAGNDGAIPSHIKFTLAPNDTGRTWILPIVDTLPGDTISNYYGMDIWGEPGKHFAVQLYILDRPTDRYIKSRNGYTTQHRFSPLKIDSITWNDSLTGLSSLYYVASIDRSDHNNKKPHFTIYSRTLQSRFVLGVGVINIGSDSTTIHGWNLNRKELHNLNSPKFTLGDTLYSINEIGGTAKRTITVGGYIGRVELPLWNKHDEHFDWLNYGELFYTSSIGPTVDGRIKPDITAPSWRVIAAISRNVPKNYHDCVIWPDTSTTFSRYGGHTGTSMASPFVAGVVALLLEAKPDLTPEEVKKILQQSAIKDKHTGQLATLSNNWGAGKINAAGAIMLLLDVPVQNNKTTASSALFSVYTHNQTIVISASAKNPVSVSVYSYNGRVVFTSQDKISNIFTIPKKISPGCYITRVQSSTGVTLIPVTIM